jgi:hypothetical protein
MTMTKLPHKQAAWLRYAAKEHRALQAREEFAPKEIPARTRDALIRRGLLARHTIEGMGGGFTYYRITDEGLAHIDAEAAAFDATYGRKAS